jgi:F0F1-type ATP synthase assembly protein I
MEIASRIARYQLLVGVIGSAAWAHSGFEAMAAALCGGCIGALLSWYSGVRMFGRVGADAKTLVMDFYRAMARKILLAVVVFAVAVKIFGSTYFAPLIITFAVSLSVYWLALLWNIRNG